MTKFYQYIWENYGKSRVELISESDAKESVRYNCKKSIKSTPIYRGTNSFNSEYGFGDTNNASKLRISANTDNYYTLIIDNSQPWSSFPKRSKSFICSTDLQEARAYGGRDTYRVIPFDGTPIGICPAGDIWDSFKDIGGLRIFNGAINLAAKASGPAERKMNTDHKFLLKTFDSIGKDYIEKNQNPSWSINLTSRLRKLFDDFAKSGKSFSDYLINVAFDPKKNGFKLKKAGNQLPKENEVWFEGKAVFIKMNELEEIEDKYGGDLSGPKLDKWANDIDNSKNKETMVT